MNKKLMAVAVAGALAAPGLAMAQAASVSIYGNFDMRLDSTKFSASQTGTLGSLTKQHLSGGTPNTVGFRGTEDLGGGLTAFFQIESQFWGDARQDQGAANSTNAGIGGRPSFLGLRSNSWGELSAGYQESLYKDSQRAWGVVPTNGHAGIIMGNGNTTGAMPSPNCTAGATAGTNAVAASTVTVPAIAAGGAAVAAQTITVLEPQICGEAPGSTTSFNRTQSNTLLYRTPTFGGFRGSVMYAIRENKEPTVQTAAGAAAAPSTAGGALNPSFWAYSGTWSGGPFAAAIGYETHTGFRATNTVPAAGNSQNRNAKDSGITLGGSWDYGKGKIGLGWERLKYAATLGTPTSATDSYTLPAWALQGTFNATGADVLWGSYSKTPGKKSCGASMNTVATATVGSLCGSDTAAKMFSFGVTHSLSKRTSLYAYYSKIDNNASANYNYPSDGRYTNNIGQGGASATQAGSNSGLPLGTDSTSYNMGVKHTF